MPQPTSYLYLRHPHTCVPPPHTGVYPSPTHGEECRVRISAVRQATPKEPLRCTRKPMRKKPPRQFTGEPFAKSHSRQISNGARQNRRDIPKRRAGRHSIIGALSLVPDPSRATPSAASAIPSPCRKALLSSDDNHAFTPVFPFASTEVTTIVMPR